MHEMERGSVEGREERAVTGVAVSDFIKSPRCILLSVPARIGQNLNLAMFENEVTVDLQGESSITHRTVRSERSTVVNF